MEFFDSKGRAVFYVSDRGRAYRWDGRPVGLLTADRFHDCDGNFIGWVRHGYLINTRGYCCLFTMHPEPGKGPTPPDRLPRPKKRTRHPFPEMPPKKSAPSFPKIYKAWGGDPFFEPLLVRLRRQLFGQRRSKTSKQSNMMQADDQSA